MNKSPIISVIIPFYNNRKLLLRAIGSVLSQTFRDFEIIVVDDGSEDDYSSIIEALQLKNLTLFKLPHKNANAARNYGISESKGDYIAMLDADDEWTKYHLASNLQAIQDCKCDGLYSGVIIKSDQATKTANARLYYKEEKMINYLLSTGFGAQTSTLFMTANAAKHILWDESLNRHQDYDFVVRFDRMFKWCVKTDITTIYHLEKKEISNICFNSCIKFIEMNRNEILPETYRLYHDRMLQLALLAKCEQSIIDHYTKNSLGNERQNIIN